MGVVCLGIGCSDVISQFALAACLLHSSFPSARRGGRWWRSGQLHHVPRRNTSCLVNEWSSDCGNGEGQKSRRARYEL
jgi:hypothetical protein